MQVTQKDKQEKTKPYPHIYQKKPPQTNSPELRPIGNKDTTNQLSLDISLQTLQKLKHFVVYLALQNFWLFSCFAVIITKEKEKEKRRER